MRIATLARGVTFGVAISIMGALTSRCGSLRAIGPLHVPLRPPPWLFGVVWPVLYATTGIAWALAGKRADALLGILTALCCMWLVAYVCARSAPLGAVILLTAAVASATAVMTLRGASRPLMIPLAVWIAFAAYLNVYDVKRSL